MIVYLYLALGLLAIVAPLYGLHKFALHLERQGYIYYLHEKPSGGGGSSMFGPLQELTQPQIKHVIEAKDESWIENENDAGDAKGPRPPAN
jgi:hypothetical protein